MPTKPDNELLSDEELRKKLADFLRYGLLNDGTVNPNTVNTLERFVNSQKQAHANMVIGEDVPIEVIDVGAGSVVVSSYIHRNQQEQRQRNSNHAKP